VCAVWRRKESTARSSKKEGGCDDECVECFHVDIVALQQRIETQKEQVGMRVVQLVTCIPEWCAACGRVQPAAACGPRGSGYKKQGGPHDVRRATLPLGKPLTYV